MHQTVGLFWEDGIISTISHRTLKRAAERAFHHAVWNDTLSRRLIACSYEPDGWKPSLLAPCYAYSSVTGFAFTNSRGWLR